MILFVVSVFFSYKNPVAGHVTVGISGIFVVLVGIICGFGLAMWCGVQFVAFTGILLFLVLGIGKENLDSRGIPATSLSVIKVRINKSIEANLFDTVVLILNVYTTIFNTSVSSYTSYFGAVSFR